MCVAGSLHSSPRMLRALVVAAAEEWRGRVGHVRAEEVGSRVGAGAAGVTGGGHCGRCVERQSRRCSRVREDDVACGELGRGAEEDDQAVRLSGGRGLVAETGRQGSPAVHAHDHAVVGAASAEVGGAADAQAVGRPAVRKW